MTDDEIDVETFDTSYLEAETELRIRASRGVVMQVLNILKKGAETVEFETRMGQSHGGWLTSAVIASHVLNVANEDIDWEKTEQVPDGAVLVSRDDIPEMIDVEFEEVSSTDSDADQ